MSAAEGWLFLFGLILVAGLLIMQVYFLIMYSDLESDYINPVDLCNQLNILVLPENGAHAFITLLFLISGQWFAFLLNLPLLGYNANQINTGKHMLDASEIFRNVPKHKKESLIKLGFYIVTFFYYLYRLIVAFLPQD